MDLFESQYDWIQRTREPLFRYCETLAQEDYVKELESFGGDSIRNLHVHVANCYFMWLGHRALGKPLPEKEPDAANVREMRQLFAETDALVHEFLHEFKGNWDQPIQVVWEDEKMEFTTLWLYTHTATHEFHHKGQIVKIGRQLGYIPPDTDLIESE
ncbi:MAG TPA: DinB family protein [Bacillales bacterium]|nr:DinB family protein [Bacillales bacterium]